MNDIMNDCKRPKVSYINIMSELSFPMFDILNELKLYYISQIGRWNLFRRVGIFFSADL